MIDDISSIPFLAPTCIKEGFLIWESGGIGSLGNRRDYGGLILCMLDAPGAICCGVRIISTPLFVERREEQVQAEYLDARTSHQRRHVWDDIKAPLEKGGRRNREAI